MRRVRLRLVVARRAHQMRGTDRRAVQPGDEQFALRHQQHATEIGLQRHPAGRVHPAEAAAVDDRGRCRLAQGVQVVVGEFFHALDEKLRRQRRCFVGLGSIGGSAMASGRPAQEVAEDADADLLTFFDVELRAGPVAGRHHRHHRSAVVGHRDRFAADHRPPGRSCARNTRGRPGAIRRAADGSPARNRAHSSPSAAAAGPAPSFPRSRHRSRRIRA